MADLFLLPAHVCQSLFCLCFILDWNVCEHEGTMTASIFDWKVANILIQNDLTHPVAKL